MKLRGLKISHLAEAKRRSHHEAGVGFPAVCDLGAPRRAGTYPALEVGAIEFLPESFGNHQLKEVAFQALGLSRL
jgi:hypothetical protein